MVRRSHACWGGVSVTEAMSVRAAEPDPWCMCGCRWRPWMNSQIASGRLPGCRVAQRPVATSVTLKWLTSAA